MGTRDGYQMVRESVDSADLSSLLASLNIGGRGYPAAAAPPIALEAGSSESGDDISPLQEEPEVVTIESSSDEEESENCVPEGTPPPPQRPRPAPRRVLDVIDLTASSNSDEEEDEDGIFAVPSTARKPRAIIIDSDSGSSSDDGNSSSELESENAPLIASLRRVLQSGGASLSLPAGRPQTQQPAAAELPQPPKIAQPRSQSHAAFVKSRTQLAQDLYAKHNGIVFQNRLPASLDITWNKRLATTAGLTHYRREAPSGLELTPRYTARIELSCKVLDTAEKLERTLVHEMCHVAAWLLDHVAKPPHGQFFKGYADRAMRALPHLDVSTCHQYEIFYSHRWECTGCSQSYGRHSRSLDETKKVCGVCRSKLRYLGKFDRDGSPAKARTPSAYNLYVKENFAAAMKERPGVRAADVLRVLNFEWKAQQQQQQAGPVDQGGPAAGAMVDLWWGREDAISRA